MIETTMTKTAFKAALEKLDLSASQTGELFDYAQRTIQRFRSGELPVPKVLAVALSLMIKYRVKPESLNK